MISIICPFYNSAETIKRVFDSIFSQKNVRSEIEVIFIDDSIQHVEGAKQVGIHAYHLESGEVEDLLKSIGIHGDA